MANLTELFKSSAEDKLSSSRAWFHFGNLAATIVFVKMGWAVSNMPVPNVEGFSWLMLVYVGMITGNKLATKFIEYKAGMTSTSTSTISTSTVTAQSKAVQADTDQDKPS